MTDRQKHFFGDFFLNLPEDDYINLEIVPAKPRPRQIEGTPLTIEQINREIQQVKEDLRMEVMA